MSAVTDRPLLAGHRVRICEVPVVPYRDAPRKAESPRRWFRVSVDELTGIVQSGGMLKGGMLTCTAHQASTECGCRTALQNSGFLNDESPFAANGR